MLDLRNLDKTDCGLLSLLAMILTYYFTKDTLFAKKENVGANVKSRDVVEVLEKSEKKALVVYCSQTGTAEDYATKFGREFQSRFQLATLVADCEDYDLDNLNEIPPDVLVFFFVSSYGEGELPDSGINFGEYLSMLDEDSLSQLNYTVFGLGNSTYEFYNGAARKVDKDLQAAGASRFAPYGEGDDGKDTLDEDYLEWKEATFELLKNSLSLKEVDAKYEPAVLVTELGSESSQSSIFLGEHNKAYLGSSDVSGPFTHTSPYMAQISSIKELFHSSSRHCVHVELETGPLKYLTGDHLGVFPPNPESEVTNFLKAFGLTEKKDVAVKIAPLDSTSLHSLPSPTTYDAAARYYLEITGPVSRQFLQSVAAFAPTEEAKARTQALAKDKALFHKEITENKLNISDALLLLSRGIPWDSVPQSFVFDSVPNLQPRFYSISSSSMKEKDRIHITAVVEASQAPNGKWVTGVTTNFLHNLEVSQNGTLAQKYVEFDLNGPRGTFQGPKIPVFVRKSAFKLPTNPGLPIILVGPGTGVAPLRGFVRERMVQKEKGIPIGKIMLFFGCRNQFEDFLYKEEWEEAKKVLGDKFDLVTAFSREGKEKVYVQHRMYEKREEIAELLKQKAFIYVCGDASNMARGVQVELAKILAEQRGISEENALEVLREFKSINRYQEDVW